MDFMMLGVMVLVALIVMMSIIGQRRHDNKKVKPVKGDDLPIWPFEPMPNMTDTELSFVVFCQATKGSTGVLHF